MHGGYKNITIFSQPSIYIDGWLYAMSMTSVVCNVPVLSQNDSTYPLLALFALLLCFSVSRGLSFGVYETVRGRDVDEVCNT